MADEITTLGLGVDTSQVKTATKDLDQMAKSGEKVETVAEALERAMANAGKASAASMASLEAAVRDNVAATQALAAAMEKVGTSTERTRTRTKEQTKQTEDLGAKSKYTAQQMQQLSFQLNDFFVQVSSGGSPLTALIQQGSQLTGTFGGVKGTFEALSTVFTASRLAIGATVGVLGTLAAVYYSGTQQSEAFRKSIILTGNAAGVTEGQFNALAKSVATAASVSTGSAREITQGLVSSGQLNGEALNKTAEAAQLFAKVTGASAEDVVKNFSSAGDSIYRFAQSLNKSYNFLSAEQLKYIKQAEEQQKSDEAIVLVMGKLSERLQTAAANVGLLERAWNSAKKAAGDFWDAAKGVGRDSTTDDLIANAEARLKALDERRSTNPAATAARRAAILAELEDLKKVKQVTEQTAKAQADGVEGERAKEKVNQQIEASLGRQARYNKAIAEAVALVDKAGLKGDDRTQALAKLTKGINDQLDPGIDAAKAQSGIASVQRTLQTLTASYQDAESILEATRQAGLIGDKEYYDAKTAFLDLYRRAQVKALSDENALLQQAAKRENLTTAERIGYQDKIKDNTAQIAQINAKAAASTQALGIQQTAAATAMAKAYQEARQSAQDYLDTLVRAQNRELALMGAGDQERQRQSGRNQISDRYDQQAQQLENNKTLSQLQGRWTTESQRQYDQQLQLINEFRTKALSAWDDYYSARLEKEKDWQVGASEALANYKADSENVAKQSQRIWENAASSMEDAILDFATTGKLNFASLANSIIRDMLRVEAQRVTSSIFSSVLGYFTGGTGTTAGITSNTTLPNDLRGGRAIGGPVSAGGVYRINEQDRPEVATFGGKDYLLTGGQSGTVRPASDSSSNGGTVVFQIASGVSRNELMALIPTLRKQILADMTAKQRRNSIVGSGA